MVTTEGPAAAHLYLDAFIRVPTLSQEREDRQRGDFWSYVVMRWWWSVEEEEEEENGGQVM